MTRLKPRKNCLGRNTLRRILLEFGQARRDFLAQPSFPLRLEILEHTQAGANNLTGIVVAAWRSWAWQPPGEIMVPIRTGSNR